MEGEETRYFAVKQNGRRLLDKAFLCDDTFKKYRYESIWNVIETHCTE